MTISDITHTGAILMAVLSVGAVSYIYYYEERRVIFHVLPYVFYISCIFLSYLYVGKIDFEFIFAILGLVIVMHGIVILSLFRSK